FPENTLTNTIPGHDEPKTFVSDSTHGINYALIAYTHNLNGTGFVLILAGDSIESTEGAGEFIFSPESLPLTLQKLRLKEGDSLPPFETVLEVKALGGTARSTRIIAGRRIFEQIEQHPAE